MLVVTGAPRSGTSVVMQTMEKLGVPMAAPAFLPQHKDLVGFNPGGFYELDEFFGIDHYHYKGMGVKLFGGQLYTTDKKFISRLIWVVRDRVEAIESYEKMRPKLPHSWVPSENVFDANIKLIRKCIDKNTLLVKLDDIKAKPEKFVTRLIEYLDINPSEEQIRSAIKNIV